MVINSFDFMRLSNYALTQTTHPTWSNFCFFGRKKGSYRSSVLPFVYGWKIPILLFSVSYFPYHRSHFFDQKNVLEIPPNHLPQYPFQLFSSPISVRPTTYLLRLLDPQNILPIFAIIQTSGFLIQFLLFLHRWLIVLHDLYWIENHNSNSFPIRLPRIPKKFFHLFPPMYIPNLSFNLFK